MFSWKKILGAFLCLIILVPMAVGCSKDSDDTVKTIKIGAVLPLSGPGGATGARYKAALELVLDEIQEAGGIKSLGGAKVEIVWADDEMNPSLARTEVERLITNEHVVAVIGPCFSGPAIAAASLADQYKIPIISLAAIADELISLHSTYWRTVTPGTNSQSYGTAYAEFAKYLIDNYGVEHDRIALINADNVIGRDQRDGMLEVLEEYGLRDNVVLDQLFDATAATMTPYALQAKAASPDILIIYPSDAPGLKWVRAMYEIDFYPPIVIDGGPLTQVDSYRAQLTPALYDKIFVENSAGFGIQTATADTPIASCQVAYAKLKAVCEDKGLVFVDSILLPLQAGYALWDALEKAGSASPEAINTALKSLSIDQEDPHFVVPVLAPAMEWDSNGIPKTYSPLFSQIQDGVQVVVYPTELKQADPRFP